MQPSPAIRRVACAIGLFLLVSGTAGARSILELPGEIIRISDGDTIVFKKTGSGADSSSKDGHLKIRLIGMDTPEAHLSTEQGTFSQGHWADEATRALTELLVPGSQANLIHHGLDKYGRVLGELMVGKLHVNIRMVELGYAIPYQICEGSECTEEFLKNPALDGYFHACEVARAQGLGVFNSKDPLREMPFEFRLRMQKRKADKYVGDFRTRVLYSPANYNSVDLCSRIFFMKKEDALRLGFRETK